MALVLAFLSAENENRHLEDLPLTDFGRLPEKPLQSVWTELINDNFVNWKLRPFLLLILKITTIVVFVIMIQRIFSILRVSANALYDCYLGIVDSFIFINEVGFSFQ